jgi:hypothetical protein
MALDGRKIDFRTTPVTLLLFIAPSSRDNFIGYFFKDEHSATYPNALAKVLFLFHPPNLNRVIECAGLYSAG